jgi:hypothetical protein
MQTGINIKHPETRSMLPYDMLKPNAIKLPINTTVQKRLRK